MELIATDPAGQPVFQIDGLKIVASTGFPRLKSLLAGWHSRMPGLLPPTSSQTSSASRNAARQQSVLRLIRGRVAEILESPVNDVPIDRPLDTLGLDSLMAFELREEIKQSIGVEVSSEVFLQDITLWDLSATLTEQLNVRMGNEGDHPSRDLFPTSSEQGEGLIEGAI